MSFDLIALNQLTSLQISQILDHSHILQDEWTSGNLSEHLRGKRIGLIVDDTGWRNTSALQLGATSMGATCVQIPITFSGREELADLAEYLSNWYDLLAIRTPDYTKLLTFVDVCPKPVLNLRTQNNHPCETLGDLAYVLSKRGSIKGLNVVCVGPANNIIHSWAEAAMVLPLKFTQIFAPEYFIDQKFYDHENIQCVDNINAIQYADIIITDSWPKNANLNQFDRYQVTDEALNSTSGDCLFIPCPPVARGQEVSVEAMNHEKCVCFPAKEYLLHVQNACMQLML
ncbi:ornithine carbamoyltransferase [Lentilitoribacter sp. EG35]|uniref:ornithine carbamoyltransferase n=1 Tax=Lentilitoribacter sp. EG35 TaxID=3234192 RepID=UPI003460E0F4